MNTLSSKKKGVIVSVICVFAVCFIFGILIGTHVICIFHKWNPATCTDAEICVYCEKTRNEAFGHTWNEADCVTAKNCDVCGLTEGEALGHNWADATCYDPKKCLVCGLVEGQELGHSWCDATCTESKTCSTCGVTEGEPIGHIDGNKELLWSDVVEGDYAIGTKCSVCGEIISREVEYYTTFINNGKFVMTPSEMMDRVDDAMSDIYNCYLTAGTKTVDGELYGVIWDSSGSAMFGAGFYGTGEDNRLTDKSSNDLRVAFGAFYDEDALTYALIAFPRACDPTIDFDEAKEIGKEILYACESGDSYDYHGVRYMLSVIDGLWILGVRALE